MQIIFETFEPEIMALIKSVSRIPPDEHKELFRRELEKKGLMKKHKPYHRRSKWELAKSRA